MNIPDIIHKKELENNKKLDKICGKQKQHHPNLKKLYQHYYNTINEEYIYPLEYLKIIIQTLDHIEILKILVETYQHKLSQTIDTNKQTILKDNFISNVITIISKIDND